MVPSLPTSRIVKKIATEPQSIVEGRSLCVGMLAATGTIVQQCRRMISKNPACHNCL
ncbi:unnamed protein product [Chondrus crispus]|uniref:Uncharacterized protein n=1 Tax=Chondrus crispus TaxID=2769 RepID=R7Q5T2_CHOCR|nr:unnamed protein product [Chondrus crispus]CDF33374.1 unnamed protein product [Chondrus crispus]|eukprot:XP_005713177.1 unnamed protein product [Chondrus crispus]